MNIFECDESASSWICRHAFLSEHTQNSSAARELLHLVKHKQRTADMDYNYTEKELKQIADLSGGACGGLMERTEWHALWGLSGNETRISFCPYCVEEDIERYCFARWRKRWSYCWFVVCDVHARPLITLRGPYRPMSVEDRSKCAFRFLVAGNAPSQQGSLVASLEFNHVSRSTFSKTLIELALSMQRYIHNILSTQGGEGEQLEFTAIKDFCDVVLRSYDRQVDGYPFVHDLTRYAFGKISQDWTLRNEFEGRRSIEFSSQLTCVRTRLSALAIAACVFELDGAEKALLELSELGRGMGIIIPNTTSWLYSSSVGGSGSMAREWHTKKAHSYSLTLNKKLMRAINKGPSIAVGRDVSGIDSKLTNNSD